MIDLDLIKSNVSICHINIIKNLSTVFACNYVYMELWYKSLTVNIKKKIIMELL